jgi:hypothetical protein
MAKKNQVANVDYGALIKKNGRPLEWTVERIDVLADALDQWVKDENNYYFGGFANSQGLLDEHMDRFAERSDKFRLTLLHAKRICEARLVENAITRKHDGNFTKFVLANKAGWRERTELSGDKNNPLSFILQSVDGNTKDIIIEPTLIDNDTKQDS